MNTLQPISNSDIDNIFSIMNKAEKAETIISNLSFVQVILGSTNSTNIREQKIKILDKMRVKSL